MSYHEWLAGADLGRGIYVGFGREELEPLFERVEELARFECQRCMAREDGLPLFYVSDPKVGNAELADYIKRYYFF